MPLRLTRFAGVSPRLALIALLVLAFSTIMLVAVALQMPAPDAPPPKGDLDTYAKVIEELKAGAPYHRALHDQLLEDGYGTLSVFNWRPPFFLWFVALFPNDGWMQAITVGLALIGAGLALRLTDRDGGIGRVPALALMFAASLIACVAPRAGLVCELTAGALILVSVSAYGLGRSWIGFCAAVAALMVREIAGLYIVVCVIRAWQERRTRELWGWGAALALYALYYGWHAYMVASLIGPADHADPVGWLRFGGADFTILTAAFNGIFLIFPYWVTAILLPLAVLGIAAMPGPGRARILFTVLGYISLFAIVGKPNNSYWGAIYTPLLCFGMVWAPAGVRDLVVSLRGAAPVAA